VKIIKIVILISLAMIVGLRCATHGSRQLSSLEYLTHSPMAKISSIDFDSSSHSQVSTSFLKRRHHGRRPQLSISEVICFGEESIYCVPVNVEYKKVFQKKLLLAANIYRVPKPPIS